MRGSSRTSLIDSRAILDSQLRGVDYAEASKMSADLFGLADVLASSTRLRRALTDPSRDGLAKANLVKDLVVKVIGSGALAIAVGAVSYRWSSPKDLVEALESLAVEAEAAAANLDGKLDDLEEELFRFGRIIAANPSLRQALVDQGVEKAKRIALVASLIDDKVTASTARLIKVLVAAPRGRSIEHGLAQFAQVAAARRNRLVALVRSAIPLSDEQHDRLGAALSARVGQPVHLNIEIDPSTIGGVAVRLGDEEIDGSIFTRITEARRALVG